jgi:hypothetical protein
MTMDQGSDISILTAICATQVVWSHYVVLGEPSGDTTGGVVLFRGGDPGGDLGGELGAMAGT